MLPSLSTAVSEVVCWSSDPTAVVSVDDEVMTLGLAADGLVYRLREQGVVVGGPQRKAQIGRIVLAEAHVEHARAGQPDAIAALAEIMRHRRDEAEAAAGFGNIDIAGGTAGTRIAVGQCPALFEIAANGVERQVVVEAIALDLAQRGLSDGLIVPSGVGA